MRYELSDYEWTAIKPMLPNKPRGMPRVNDRRILNGIFWVLGSRGAQGLVLLDLEHVRDMLEDHGKRRLVGERGRDVAGLVAGRLRLEAATQRYQLARLVLFH